MKIFAALSAAMAVLALPAAPVHATTYYVNPNGWSDNNVGTSAGLPWKTLNNVNGSKVVSGDTVLFFRGATWYDTLYLKSGVTYGAYGSGAKPVIRGSKDVGGLTWTHSAPGNTWVANVSTVVPAGSNIGDLYLNGQRLIRARTPNVGSGDYNTTTFSGSRYRRITETSAANVLNIGPNVVPTGENVQGATAFVRSVGSDLFESTVNDWVAGSTTALAVTKLSVLDDWELTLAFANAKDQGYWLENKRWMLDSAKEWFFDAGTRLLYVWMPNGATPQGQALFAAYQGRGIVGENVSNVSVSNIEVRETKGDAISLIGASGGIFTDIDVIRAGRRGISLANSSNNSISYANVQDSASVGIWLGDARTDALAVQQPSVNTSITYSTINNAGKGAYAHAAVSLGYGGFFLNNKVTNSSYIGVISLRGTSIQNNFVLNSCTDFDDCAGIYVSQPSADPQKLSAAASSAPATQVLYPNNIDITNNIVVGGTGSDDGTAVSTRDARGIYLDDYVNGVTVSRNYVSGMKYGYMLHTAFNNTFTDNLAIGNRSHNLLLQEDAVPDVGHKFRGSTSTPAPAIQGAMSGNVFTHNGFVAARDATAPTLPIPPNIQQIAEGGYGPTGNFARYYRNQYGTLNTTQPSILAYNYGSDVTGQDMTLQTWQTLSNHDTPATLHDSPGGLQRIGGQSYGFYNPAGSAPLSIACPAASAPNCTFVNILTGGNVTLPTTLSSNSSFILSR